MFMWLINHIHCVFVGASLHLVEMKKENTIFYYFCCCFAEIKCWNLILKRQTLALISVNTAIKIK